MVSWISPPFASLLLLSSGSPSVQVQPPGCTAEAPQNLLSRRGGIPEQQKRAGSKHSSAPITSKCQSFLDNLVAQFAGNRESDDPMGTASCCTPLIPRAAS
jgi:hypothetical protein